MQTRSLTARLLAAGRQPSGVGTPGTIRVASPVVSAARRLSLGAPPARDAAGTANNGVATPCVVLRNSPPVPTSSAARRLTVERSQADRAPPPGYDSPSGGSYSNNPLAEIGELDIRLTDCEREMLALAHEFTKLARERDRMANDIAYLLSEVESLKGGQGANELAQQSLHDAQEEVNRCMDARVGKLELSMTSMQRGSAASAKAAELRPACRPGDETPSTSGRDMHTAVHALPDELSMHMSWEAQRTACTLKLDSIVKYQDQAQDLYASAEAAIKALGGPPCTITYARWATPRQAGRPPSRLIVTFETQDQAAKVLHMVPFLAPWQRIYPELGPVEAAVAKVTRQEFGCWARQVPPALRAFYRVDRACVMDGKGRCQPFSQAAIDAGMAALQRYKDRQASRPMPEARA